MKKYAWQTAGERDELAIAVATEEVAYRTAEIGRLKDLKNVGWAAQMTESLDFMIRENRKKLEDAKRVLARELENA